MPKRSRTVKTIVVSSVGVVLCCTMIIVGLMGPCRILTSKFEMDRLLNHTDHESLLVACRSLMKPEFVGVYHLTWSNKHPDAFELPKEILALRPQGVTVFEDGRVLITVVGGMSHWGVVAYSEDFKDPYEDYKPGNKKLIDGLWLYSDFTDLNEE